MVNTDGDALLLYCGGFAFLNPTHAFHRRIIQSMDFMFTGNVGINLAPIPRSIIITTFMIS